MGLWSKLAGTMVSTFGIGPKATRATLDASALTAARTLTVPDKTGTLATVTDDYTVTALTDGATITLDALAGSKRRYKVTLGGNRTLSISNIADGQKIEVIVRQDGTGSRTLAYSGITIKWQGGSAPTLTTTAGKADILVIWREGSDYFGFVAQNF